MSPSGELLSPYTSSVWPLERHELAMLSGQAVHQQLLRNPIYAWVERTLSNNSAYLRSRPILFFATLGIITLHSLAPTTSIPSPVFNYMHHALVLPLQITIMYLGALCPWAFWSTYTRYLNNREAVLLDPTVMTLSRQTYLEATEIFQRRVLRIFCRERARRADSLWSKLLYKLYCTTRRQPIQSIIPSFDPNITFWANFGDSPDSSALSLYMLVCSRVNLGSQGEAELANKNTVKNSRYWSRRKFYWALKPVELIQESYDQL